MALTPPVAAKSPAMRVPIAFNAQRYQLKTLNKPEMVLATPIATQISASRSSETIEHRRCLFGREVESDCKIDSDATPIPLLLI
jgi:hypothetical protein